MKILKLSALLLTLLIFACANKNAANNPTANQQDEAVSAEKSAADLQEENNKNAANNINFAENSTVYFDFDVSTPKSDEANKIANQAEWLKANDFKQVIIEGYTDIYGTREYNLALGERRANSIKEILVKNGVDPKKIKVVSYGKEHLADHDVQWKNRRSITKVEH